MAVGGVSGWTLLVPPLTTQSLRRLSIIEKASAPWSASAIFLAGLLYHAYLPRFGVEVRPVFELEPALLSLHHICDFELSQLIFTRMASRRDGRTEKSLKQ